MLLITALAQAAELQAPMSCLGAKPKMGDVFTFTEACDAKRVPLNEPGVRIVGARTLPGSGATAGARTTLYSISKGNETYELRVPLSVKEADLRAGRVGDTADCTHKISFALNDPFATTPAATTRSTSLEKTDSSR